MIYTANYVTPVTPKNPGHMNGSRYNSFEYSGRNPISPIQGHGLTSSEGGTYYHWWPLLQTIFGRLGRRGHLLSLVEGPQLLYPQENRVPAYLSGSNSYVYS
ncbi:hypothetical protein AVEN_108336-1 [Araneus ventricosus]|uniref:Uncharacterized protein n=1 Tax=Araneus ventricosus TaxID=182803 RepID=A0A4Y2UA85_ARAVE|nr:hypothetical protein AVEN_108336-1 [Araneus ventricosus]